MKSITEENEEKRSLNPVFWLTMGAAAIIIAGIVIFLMVSSSGTQKVDKLEGALREGAEFEQLSKKISVAYDTERTIQSPTGMGTIQMTVAGIVRNFTGKTITGLELTGAVVDIKGAVVKQRTFIAIPNRQPTLENNKAMAVNILIEGFKKEDDRANIKWSINAIKVE